MRRTPPLDELQPPPYQDDSGSPHLSCTPSEIGDSKCEFSHCSNSPRCSYNKCPSEGSTGHEIESFHNKGYEEDVPSDIFSLQEGIWQCLEMCFSVKTDDIIHQGGDEKIF